MNIKINLKRIALAGICAVFCCSVIGCGNKDTVDKTEIKTENAVTENNTENTEDSVKSDITDESATADSSDTEAPVIESAEQLEGMVDEFNSTDDPERKEELRQQLEKILEQAEAQASKAD